MIIKIVIILLVIADIIAIFLAFYNIFKKEIYYNFKVPYLIKHMKVGDKFRSDELGYTVTVTEITKVKDYISVSFIDELGNGDCMPAEVLVDMYSKV